MSSGWASRCNAVMATVWASDRYRWEFQLRDGEVPSAQETGSVVGHSQ
jgi:hypothetical protein